MSSSPSSTATPPPNPVRLNEACLPWTEGLTVAALLQAQGIAPQSIATALNGEFVARAAREHTLLRPGDTLTTFSPIVGG